MSCPYIKVVLSPKEIQEADNYAEYIEHDSADIHLQNSRGCNLDFEQSLENRKNSFRGELAASIVYDLPWNKRARNFSGADLATRFEVKTTREWYRKLGLFIPAGANELYLYILVIGQIPLQNIYWVVGHDDLHLARKHGYAESTDLGNKRKPGWFIPVSKLTLVTPAPPWPRPDRDIPF